MVYYPLFNEKNCGFHTKRFIKDKREDFVYINTAKPIAEQVFTAAHELGHVWDLVKQIAERPDSKVSKKDLIQILNDMGERDKRSEMKTIWNNNHDS